MQYKYFTLAKAPKVGENIKIDGRLANVRFVSDERKPIEKSLISRQPELLTDGGFLAVRVGFEFID
ncbi:MULTISPECIES: hypothetical protein [unclassified Psychrobacter]|uniref:hypothetical protein n=1 Tax=unclassified Psychrobacter TaxID=196806 RepID=UPI000C7CE143|nr:hypothetical protein [Psychrobacter sp. 4Bb]PKH82280.1 hypothetical protein CXF60_02095 [Psychrobacter sp. 4Bb]|tara:strand:+ start:254 stop:451 length:198 start_codon:yes stop_codon:yes gene_type:complete